MTRPMNQNGGVLGGVDWEPDGAAMLDDVYGHLETQRGRCPLPLALGPRGEPYYAALRYQDVVKVVTDRTAFSSSANMLAGDLRRIPIELDPPEHTAMRRVLQPFFAPKRMQKLRPRIGEYARKMIAELLEAIPVGGSGSAEYVENFASPFPTRVLCATLNLPDEDWDKLKKWSLAVSSQVGGRGPRYDEANEALKAYARGIVDSRRQEPLPVEEDMASGLLAARPDGRQLTDDEMVGVLRLMFAAGHLTTTIALGIITRYLAENPDQQQRLRDTPEAVDHAIDEILRHTAPVVANANPRTVIAPVELGDRLLRPGDRVLPVWGAGNRDEDRFLRPDTIDFDRPAARNLTFGHGAHLCLGAPVARFELGEATRVLLAETTAFSIAGDVAFGDFWRQRGPTRLQLDVTRA